MKTFYVCMPSVIDSELRGYENDLYAYTDNRFLLNQYIKNTYPKLQEQVGKNYELSVEEYMAVERRHLFEIVEAEHGQRMNEQNEIFSITSVNNPEIVLYLTQYTSEAHFTDYDSIFDTFIRNSYSGTKTYNIIKDMLKVPSELKETMDLVDAKYLPLLIALTYSDMYDWLNAELVNMINQQLPEHLKDVLNIEDVMDGCMVMVLFGEWVIL